MPCSCARLAQPCAAHRWNAIPPPRFTRFCRRLALEHSPMTLLRCGFLALLTLTLLSACTSVVPPAKPPGSPASITPIQLTQGSILAAINGTRAAAGKPPLRYNIKLENAARSQSNLMAPRIPCRTIWASPCASVSPMRGTRAPWARTWPGGNRRSNRRSRVGWRLRRTANPAVDQVPGVRPRRRHGAGQRPSKYRTYWSFIAGGPFEAWR